MDLVKVTYHDVTEYEEVEYEKELHELKPNKVELIGWVLKRDDNFMVLAIGKSDETYEHVYVIPSGCILNIDKIQ